MGRIPKYSRLRMLASCGLIWLGNHWIDGSPPAFWLGFFTGSFGMGLLLREAWIIGFHDGVKSVPLDGVGLVSGDERAFDGTHHWNPDLGAWEKPK